MHRDTTQHRNGVTLIEVMMAVALTGVAILCAGGILQQVQSVSSQVIESEAAVRAIDARNELLRSLVAQTVAPRDTSESFDGSGSRARFHTVCRKSRGWLEACQATLRVVKVGDTMSLYADVPEMPAIPVVRKADALSLLYLSDARDGGHWIPSWGSSIGVPGGIGIVRQLRGVTDTVFLRIGTRG